MQCYIRMYALIYMYLTFQSKGDAVKRTLSEAHDEERPCKQKKLDSFVVGTTEKEKEDLDLSIGKFFFANNISFRVVESEHFKALVSKLRPGYSPPNRIKLGDSVLDAVHTELVSEARQALTGKEVTLCLDGWSNVNSESLIVASIQWENSVYIVDSIDCSAERHTGEYLATVAEKQVQIAEAKFGVTVVALVSDNASNMTKMRKIMTKGANILTYGCSAHQLNLLAKDLVPSELVTQVTKIAKCFRNSHLPSSWLKNEGGKKPPMPSDVRWNSYLELFEWYSNEWQRMKRIADSNPTYFNSFPTKEITRLLCDIDLLQQVEKVRKGLCPICHALDMIQANTCTVADAVENWKIVLRKLEEMGDEYEQWFNAASRRYSAAIPPSWFVANILHPEHIGENLSQDEMKLAFEWIAEQHPSLTASFTDFVGGDRHVINSSLKGSIGCSLRKFLKAQIIMGALQKDLGELCIRMISLVPSSAGIERVFSSMGFVHSDVRNRLQQEKVAKLAFCMRVLNEKL